MTKIVWQRHGAHGHERICAARDGMRAAVFAVCAVLAATTVQAEDIAGPILQPGLWEMRITRDERDGNALLAEKTAQREQALARMTPEKRKEWEERRRRDGFDPATGARRRCMGPKSGKYYFSDKFSSMSKMPGCTPFTVTEGSGHRTIYEISCTSDKGNTLKTKVVATDDLVTTTIVGDTIGADGARHKSIWEEQVQFIGRDCGDLKPPEQMP